MRTKFKVGDYVRIIGGKKVNAYEFSDEVIKMWYRKRDKIHVISRVDSYWSPYIYSLDGFYVVDSDGYTDNPIRFKASELIKVSKEDAIIDKVKTLWEKQPFVKEKRHGI